MAPLALHTGAVDRVVDTAPLAPLDPSLHGADVAVNLHGRGPESTAVLAATEPGRLIAFDLPGGPTWRDEEHERARWCRLLTESGVPADPDDLRVARPGVAPPPVAAGATVLHPGASSASRRWPAERWADLARWVQAEGHRVVLTGSAEESDLAADVADLAGLPPDRVLAGRTDLLELLAAVAAAERVVAGDTGTAHVASALGVPSVLLFGPTPPSRWGPPAGGPHVVLWAGSTGDPHAARTDPGLLAIGVDDVLDALDRLPGSDQRHTART